MKRNASITMLATATLLAAGCGIDTSRLNPKHDQQSSKSMSQADQDLYASDTLESTDAGDTTSPTQALDTNANVGEKIKAHVKEMADRMIKDLDADSSGSLSQDEFLSGPEKLRKKVENDTRPEPSEDMKAKMREKLTADFKEFAGDDSQLSSEELQKLLLAKGPKKGGRGHEGRGHGPRGKGHGPRGHGPGGSPRLAD